MKVLRTVLLMLALLLVMAAPAIAQAPPPLDVVKWSFPPAFKNVTITVVGDAGHNLKPYEFWKNDFEKVGITIQVIEVPFEGVYEKEKTEFIAATGAFDVVTFYPAYIGDFAGNRAKVLALAGVQVLTDEKLRAEIKDAFDKAEK